MTLPDTEQTIVAQATPPGTGALAVIRLSGPGAFCAAASFTRPPQKAPQHRRAVLLDIADGAKLIDRVVAVFFRAPASYTGQDTVEITCHGSPFIIRSILNLAVRAGARPAAPGEFTLRAFLNGKLDLAQAEAVGGLIAAGSEAAHRAAISQVRGELSAEVLGLREKLVRLLAQLEARLDDSYEETPVLDVARFAREAAAVSRDTLRLAAGFESGRGIREGVRVAITGAPNSGKSSLLNALLGYDRAIVSPQAGTTRDTLDVELEIHGFSVIFTDTAGINAAKKGPLEKEGMDRAAKAVKAADIVLLLKDASTGTTASDKLALRRALEPAPAQLIRILSKADLPRAARGAGLKVSSRTGEGLPALKKALVARQKRAMKDGAQAAVTFARHFDALNKAAAELGKLAALLRAGAELELQAEHLRRALAALASISGETAPEEVLADIFRNFCVGK
ncbi:MAG TPA: tRNA uridine-5-carboxymethylaminomethyl(34) synthesis GTPase MnmE [Elusimicrobia bacterium]|nr:MAG: tRNA uridine-5-carboxymethylaminomethyl(34) synthesis GTPase MnmE [Elusimicrobia bacterium GWF2_62_30]HBA60423.1 tRNA uridine-5-carboxymethylaminomethyl(34) synthesis GTPase MnmE [Elusimicrobiota bacterium]